MHRIMLLCPLAKNFITLIPRTNTEKDFARVTRIKSLEMGDHPEFARWAQLNHVSPHKQRIFLGCGQKTREKAA